MVAAAVIIAILWGYLATRLYLHPEHFSLSSILSGPKTLIHRLFLLYLVPMAVTFLSGVVIPGAIDLNPGNQAAYPLSQTSYRVVEYSTIFLAIAVSVIFAFVSYPFFILVKLRSQLRDEEVRHALRVIASCFGIISMLLFAENAVASFGVSLIGLVHIVSVGLLILVVRAFKKPSFLKSFLGVVPSLENIPSARRSHQTVLVYPDESRKFAPLSTYVSEGVNQGGRVLYFYTGDESNIREGLARNGVDVRHHILKGNLRLIPLSSLYQSDGVLDEEAALTTCAELGAEARALGKESLKLIVDYQGRMKRPYYKFVEHLADPRWTTPDHYVHVLMAFSKAAFRGLESTLDLIKSKLPVIDLTDATDAFSRSAGLSHSEVVGKKILLEFDPSSDYEKVVKSLIAESASNFEHVVFFTRLDSPVRSLSSEGLGLKTFILTSRVSYPKVEEENRVLLPAYDTSLVLDALNKTIEVYAGASFTAIFDNISHYIFMLGQERTQSLVRQSLELMISDKITAVFLVNFQAHDEKTMSAFENLFDIELICRAGARVPELRRKLAITN